MSNNYTLGRGKVYFSRFASTSDPTPTGFRYLGNTPEFNLTIESETLDHFSSDEGIREKDDSVPLEVTRTGSLITDNIDPENVALFFFGANSDQTIVAAASQSETLSGVLAGHSYQIGATTGNPAGLFGIDNGDVGADLTAAVNGGSGLTAGTDYEVDYEMGFITFFEDAGVTDGDDIDLTYDVLGSTRDRVISGSEPVEGAMMYRTKNPKGADCMFYMPYVKITPNGDYALKGDEWQQLPLSLEILKPASQEAIYRDGTPVFS